MIHEKRYYFNSLNNLRNLKFLKKCRSLSILDSDAKDFSPISEMPEILTLSIVYSSANRNLSDIKWITKLTKLQILTLYNCSRIDDLTPLTQLKNLKTLDIRGSGVQNTSMLSSSIAITR
jgi:Leucine-rich repeat (LRR) protein